MTAWREKVKVDTLPEKSEPWTFYETPDGNVWFDSSYWVGEAKWEIFFQQMN
mgnify:CR=1 FL=1